MSEFNVKEFSKSLDQLDSPEAVDEAFSAVYALPPTQRNAVANALAYEFRTAVEEEIAKDVRQNGLAATKQFLEKGLLVETKDITGLQISAQQLFHVENILLRETPPLIKAFNKAAANLTDEEYSGPQIVVETAKAVAHALAVSEGLIKPNPLRRNTPPARP